MTRRAWWCVVGAYALLAIGATVTLSLLANTNKYIKKTNEHLILAAVAYCEIAYLPTDRLEEQAMEQFASMISTAETKDIIKHEACKQIAIHLEEDT